MEEIEVPLEQTQEDMHHHIEHSHGDSPGQNFMMRGALLSALLAVLAAISALMAGHAANEAMLEQIHASDSWAYYQAKGIKASIAEIRVAVNPKGAEAIQEKISEYKKEQEEIKKEAQEKENESKQLLAKHETLASCVTFFQIAIALTAIAVLTKKRRFMGVSLILGILGVLFLIKGLWFA